MSDNINPKIAVPVVLITLLFAITGLMFPEFLIKIQYPLLGILIVTIGLPHGATDYLLFRRINKSRLSKHQILKFFITYIAAVLGFLVLWLIFPLFSFFTFIMISSYHFGQSNWENIFVEKKHSLILNLFWGAFAIGGSVLWHWQESKIIIGQVIGFLPDIPQFYMDYAQLSLIAVNCLFLLLLKFNQTINSFQLLKEFGKLAVLCCLFYFTPMLVGFALYFTLWHSLGSLMSQLSYYKNLWPDFTLKDYYRQAAPYTILAVAGFTIMVFGHSYILPGVSVISTFLVFIACVTFPHIMVVDERYQD